MGTKSQKRAKTRLDAYYRLAKDQGYRARSAFKLIQLNRKYDFLSKSKNLVDLCAAPGGWLQVAAKYMPVGSKILGCDLVPIAPIKGCKTFVGDITEDSTRKKINQYLKKEPVDVVIHDGAPNVGGVWSKDLFAQNALVLSALKLATGVLRPGGWFVTKVFRSTDFQKLIWVFKQFFEKVEATKPMASRMESAEIFVACSGYKAPKQIDPKMFLAAHVFADVGEEKIMNQSGVLVAQKNLVPQGYDEFSTVIHRVATLNDFLRAADPKAFLKQHHEIRFDQDADKPYLQLKASKKELVFLCHDLQQVGEGDRRKLIRWREVLLREESRRRLEAGLAANGAAATADGADSDAEADAGSDAAALDVEDGDNALPEFNAETDEQETRRLTEELLQYRKLRAKEQKKKQKKQIDAKLKQIRGLINYDPHESAAHPTNMGDDDEDGFGGGNRHDDSDVSDDDNAKANRSDDAGIEDNDWTIGNVRDVPEDMMSKMFDRHYEAPEGHLNTPFDAVQTMQPDGDDEVDMGAAGAEGDDGRDHDVQDAIEELDVDNYGNFIPTERAARVAIFDRPGADDDLLDDELGEEDAEAVALRQKKSARAERDEAALDSAGKQSKWQRRHLNIDHVLNRTFPKVREGRKRKRNTDEELIEMRNAVGDAEDADARREAKRRLEEGRMRDESSDEDSERSNNDDEDDDDISSFGASDGSIDGELRKYEKGGREDSRRKKQIVPSMKKLTTAELTKAQRKQVLKQSREAEKKQKNQKGASKKGKNGKEDTSFEVIPMAMTDPDIRSRTLAIATKMLDKKSRREILDNAINRYTHNDDDDLPEWFVKDEQRNCRVQMPITAAEIEAQRERFRELSSRPSRKVAEAVGRKRRKAQRMLHALVEKGRTDPRARTKASGLSVRKLMRSKAVKGDSLKKKKQPLDPKQRGQMKREKQRVKRDVGKKGKRKH